MKAKINEKVSTKNTDYVFIKSYPNFNLYQKVKIFKDVNGNINHYPLYKECFYN